ncbi:CMRF35-like molecule 1 isoform X1 [Anguilla rostrata]|uniref:CMRF35-like molecule 1 isoform X1 n=1 Tax=Anguilla rostrata TaxID=7938 RepID=UPI0030D2E164
MAKLKTEDSEYYWCAVEIGNNLIVDESKYLYLSVTAGTPGLRVDQQEVTGVEGGCVSVQCHYNESSSMKKWCRAEGSCVEVNSNKSERAEIKDNRSENVFIVTMRELNREDTGWYWCAAGELQIPVHINVTQKTTTPTVTTPPCTSPPVGSAVTPATSTEPSSHKRTAATGYLSSSPPTATNDNNFSELTVVLMTSGALLLLLVAVAVVTWKLWKKHGESARANAGAREGGTSELTTVHPEEEVTYSTVFTNARSSSRRMNSPQSQPSENPAGEVMYCSVILQNPQ